MASCEKCWDDASGLALLDHSKNKVEHYHELLKTAKCTPEEQAGEYAKECANCKRRAVHQYAKVCMACGSKY